MLRVQFQQYYLETLEIAIPTHQKDVRLENAEVVNLTCFTSLKITLNLVSKLTNIT